MSEFLALQTDFNLLPLRDLLSARDYLHLHLVHKRNVVATDIGRYRIRKSDAWPDEKNRMGSERKGVRAHLVRTLDNSEVRPYSWPAVVVSVEKWLEPDEFNSP